MVRALVALIEGLEPRKPRYHGLLGSPGGTVAVSGRPGYVYFREDGNPSKLRQVFNSRVPTLNDLPVVVGEDSNNPGSEQVLDIDIGMLPNWLDRSFLPEHHETHELGTLDSNSERIDNDVVWVQKGQFVPLSVYPQSTPDMTLYVNEDWYVYGDELKYWGGGSTKAFSAPVVAGYAAFELICIDGETNQLIYVRGPDYLDTLGILGDLSLIPDAPVGSVPLVAVYLPHGVSSLLFENIADVRVFQRTLGGNLLGSPHRHTSEADGGLLSSGLTVTGDQYWKRASDDETILRFFSELGDVHLGGNIVVTGDVTITGGTLAIAGDANISMDLEVGGNDVIDSLRLTWMGW